MRQTYRDLDKNGKGRIDLVPEEDEDMWHAYNLIAKGDHLRASTIRKVVNETFATGSTTTQKRRITLTVAVVSVDFDIQACALRVKGRNVRENDYVKIGAYHTLDLEKNRKFSLEKDHWDSIDIERIDEACDPARHADLGAIIMQEGLAHVCIVTSVMTLVRQKIEVNIPRKRKGFCQQHDKGVTRFYEQVMQAILRHFDFNIIKCVLLASPGFVRDQFHTWLFSQAAAYDTPAHKSLLESKSKFVLVHSSSGFKHSLKEVLADPGVAARLAETKAAGEVKALDDFYTMLSTDSDRAFYGLAHVQKAHELQAIETLLISDDLFRSSDLATRKKYVRLVEEVRECGSDVRIFSVLHVSGEQLAQLGGIAAILRFPIPDDDENYDYEYDEVVGCDDNDGDTFKAVSSSSDTNNTVNNNIAVDKVAIGGTNVFSGGDKNSSITFSSSSCDTTFEVSTTNDASMEEVTINKNDKSNDNKNNNNDVDVKHYSPFDDEGNSTAVADS